MGNYFKIQRENFAGYYGNTYHIDLYMLTFIFNKNTLKKVDFYNLEFSIMLYR